MTYGCIDPAPISAQVKKAMSMHQFARSALDFLGREDGPTAVEYAVMLALIIVVCMTAISTLGSTASSTFSYVGTKVSTAS
jgi:pilus assembly protein Flp/PilA